VQVFGAIVRRPQLNSIRLRRILIHPNARSPQTGSRSRQGGTFAPTRRKWTPWVSSSKGKLTATSIEATLARVAVILFLLLLAIAMAAEALDCRWARFWLVAASS
jgi:hypothetical protein